MWIRIRIRKKMQIRIQMRIRRIRIRKINVDLDPKPRIRKKNADPGRSRSGCATLPYTLGKLKKQLLPHSDWRKARKEDGHWVFLMYITPNNFNSNKINTYQTG